MSVVRDWVSELPMMQQTVLLTTVRGPDGLRKGHPAKKLMRWYRRCILKSAMDNRVLPTPWERGGGSFTGPSVDEIPEPGFFADVLRRAMRPVVQGYMDSIDELPLHYHMHVLHSVEILGYKYPEDEVRDWWREVYGIMVADLHLEPELSITMDSRLGDNEMAWRASDARGKA